MIDTIVALGTPEGRGGLAVIRVSGPCALNLTEKLFVANRQRNLADSPWKLVSGHIMTPDHSRTIDEVLVGYFQNPRSYTGEDLVEISCHGNPVISASIINCLISIGARLAGPGEFTRRAFMNGRIDLSRAEAVAELTSAESDAAAASAIKLLQGGLSQPVQLIRESLLQTLTAIELDLDFPEEDATISTEELRSTLEDARRNIYNLLEAGHRGDLIRTGTDIVLAGRVNAGKSSVFNKLTGRDRAIVSDEPGTTRDSLEAVSQWNGYSVTLIDTAGIRETASSAETEAIRRAVDWINQTQIILYILDGSEPDLSLLKSVSDKTKTSEIIVFWNKTDCGNEPSHDEIQTIQSFPHVVKLLTGSAKTGQGISELREQIIETVQKKTPGQSEQTLMMSLRQKNALTTAESYISSAWDSLEETVGTECIAPLLLSAHRHLGEILGDTVAPDVLGEIFSRFCIGK